MNTYFPKMKNTLMLMVFTVVLIVLEPFSSTVQAQSAQSNALFAQGMKLYQSGQFKEAIPYFAKSDSLDTIEMDSIDAHKGIAATWLASSYFKSGNDLEGAMKSSSYMLEPVDRRKTIKSDALVTKALKAQEDGDFTSALELLIQAKNKEKKTLGNNHHWVGNTMEMIADCLLQLGDTVQAAEYRAQALENSLKTRGAVMHSISWNRAHQLLELYSNLSKSGFYTLIQNMLLCAKDQINPDMKHDIEIELAYLSWKKEPQDIAISEKRMRQALEECERIHGTSSQHFSYMTSVMTEFLCGTGDFETALRYNDKAFEHYHNGGSMLHLAYQMLSRDRMAIMLGLGRIEEAVEIGKNILRKCEYHHPVELFNNYSASPFELLGINEQPLEKNDLNKLRQLAPTLISQPLPLLCPSDSDLVKNPSPLSVTQFSQHTRLSFSVIDALIILAQLENDTISHQAEKQAASILSYYQYNDIKCEAMPPIFDEKIYRYFELNNKFNRDKDVPGFGENDVLKFRRELYSGFYYSEKSRHHYSDLNIKGDLMLHFAIQMLDDSLEVNALPFYNDYVQQKQQFFKKPLDQLTPSEQGLRRRYLFDEKRYATEIKHFESLLYIYY